jgi:hypothetical protein
MVLGKAWQAITRGKMKGIGGILKIYLLTRVKKSLEWQQE